MPVGHPRLSCERWRGLTRDRWGVAMEQTGEVGRGAAPARSRRAAPDARRAVQRRRPAAAGTSGEAWERKVRGAHAIWEREGRPWGAAVTASFTFSCAWWRW